MFSFIALPEETILQKLNDIRKYLYINGFRYSNNPPASDAHITLFSFENYPSTLFLDKLKALKDHEQVFINNYKLINRPHSKTTNKMNEPSNWIALQFESKSLIQVSEEIMEITEIDSEVSADHMNLCNYARPEKSQEAIEYIQNMNLPETFLLNTIAIRNGHGDLLWKNELR